MGPGLRSTKINIFPNNRMIKKNISERRFNTAAARIMLNNKLPSDFFLPSREKENRESSLYSHRHEDAEAHPSEGSPKKDPLLFTFHRSSSEDHLKHRKARWPTETPAPKLFSNIHRKSQPKLPPVSVQMPKQGGKENINTNWFKDFGVNKDKLKKLGRISNKLLAELNHANSTN